jgi:hypothetical protein
MRGSYEHWETIWLSKMKTDFKVSSDGCAQIGTANLALKLK